ncbi:hypothetical protein [Tsukamurella soli]|uniref:Uncharacterized protein n=1 Tax=Tsukamurella soli TaxID=644556 RepID=A0ABP8JS28_9ACTN
MTDAVRDYSFAPDRTIRLMSDYCSRPLWACGSIDTDTVGLSADLVVHLDDWQHLFDAHFQWETGWDDLAVRARYDTQGHALLPLVAAELPGYIVELDLWPTNGGHHRAGTWEPGWEPPPRHRTGGRSAFRPSPLGPQDQREDPTAPRRRSGSSGRGRHRPIP